MQRLDPDATHRVQCGIEVIGARPRRKLDDEVVNGVELVSLDDGDAHDVRARPAECDGEVTERPRAVGEGDPEFVAPQRYRWLLDPSDEAKRRCGGHGGTLSGPR